MRKSVLPVVLIGLAVGRRLVSRVDRAAFGAGGNGLNYDDADATARFNALEGHYHYVVYVTDDVPSAWSEKALRQADALRQRVAALNRRLIAVIPTGSS